MMSNLLKPAPEKPVVAIKAICQQVCSQILGIRDYAMGEGRPTCSKMKPLPDRPSRCFEDALASHCVIKAVGSGTLLGFVFLVTHTEAKKLLPTGYS